VTSIHSYPILQIRLVNDNVNTRDNRYCPVVNPNTVELKKLSGLQYRQFLGMNFEHYDMFNKSLTPESLGGPYQHPF
jgi:hypothetical protein